MMLRFHIIMAVMTCSNTTTESKNESGVGPDPVNPKVEDRVERKRGWDEAVSL